jgi:hypothetical protein
MGRPLEAYVNGGFAALRSPSGGPAGESDPVSKTNVTKSAVALVETSTDTMRSVGSCPVSGVTAHAAGGGVGDGLAAGEAVGVAVGVALAVGLGEVDGDADGLALALADGDADGLVDGASAEALGLGLAAVPDGASNRPTRSRAMTATAAAAI